MSTVLFSRLGYNFSLICDEKLFQVCVKLYPIMKYINKYDQFE